MIVLDYAGPWIVQVNDYIAAEVWQRPIDVIQSKGLRRFLSLVWRNAMESRVLKSNCIVISNSEFTRRRLLGLYATKETIRFQIVYKAVDTTAFASSEEHVDPYPDRPVGHRVVFVGSDWRTKGLDDLFEAFQILRCFIPSIHLTVAGPSETYDVRRIERMIEKCGLGSHVLLAGRVERKQLLGLYRHSDLFVLPSKDEAFGVAILEAMASGLPVVASHTGGIPEVVRHGENGYLFHPGNVSELVTAVGRLLRDDEIRDKFRTEGLETARKFDLSLMISSIRKLYAVALAESNGKMS